MCFQCCVVTVHNVSVTSLLIPIEQICQLRNISIKYVSPLPKPNPCGEGTPSPHTHTPRFTVVYAVCVFWAVNWHCRQTECCCELACVQELAGLITVNRETHKLLSKFLQLDDFNSLLCEANNCVSAPVGRIPLCMLLELSVHFLPHYCYNDATRR